MRFTRNKLRLAIGVLVCSVGVVLLFSRAILIPRLLDGAAWLFIGGALCFVPEFHLRLSRDWFTLGLGLLLAIAGSLFTAFAAMTLFGDRPHGLAPFYELIGIGPMLLFAGVLVGFDKKHSA